MDNTVIAIGVAFAALLATVTFALDRPVGLCANPGYSTPNASVALPVGVGLNIKCP